MSKENKNIFILGSNGRLAKSLINFYSADRTECLDRTIYQNWSKPDAIPGIRLFFESKHSTNTKIFVTSGVLDSKEDLSLINNVNFHLPWNIIKATAGLNIQVITFGTILENIQDTANPYVQSKIRLSRKIVELEPDKRTVLHFRIHTLYGYGYPSDFMFLGQLFNALKKNEIFKMSAGYQIREYHHLDDIAHAVNIIISKGRLGIIELTSGNGIKLRELAIAIFKNFGKENLLKIGILDIQFKDKFFNDYKKNDDLKSSNFREPIEGVCNYLKTII